MESNYILETNNLIYHNCLFIVSLPVILVIGNILIIILKMNDKKAIFFAVILIIIVIGIELTLAIDNHYLLKECLERMNNETNNVYRPLESTINKLLEGN